MPKPTCPSTGAQPNSGSAKRGTSGTRTQPTQFSRKHQLGFIEDLALGHRCETFQYLHSSFLHYDMIDSQPSISAYPYCTPHSKTPGAFPNQLEKLHLGQSRPIKQKQVTSRNDQHSGTDTLKKNICNGNDFALFSPFADSSELDLRLLGRGKVTDQLPSHSACPFCNQPVKSAGALANSRDKIHTGQSLPIKWKQGILSNNQSSETSSLGENMSGGNLYYAMRNVYANYSELTDLIPTSCDKDEGCEEMLYSDNSLFADQVNNSSNTNALFDHTIHFPVDREAGKAVVSYLF